MVYFTTEYIFFKILYLKHIDQENRFGIINAMANKKEKMTIEDLAGMIERNLPKKEDINGIKEKIDIVKDKLSGEIQSLRSEYKKDIREVKGDIWGIKIELEEVHEIVKRIDEKDLPNLKRRVTTL